MPFLSSSSSSEKTASSVLLSSCNDDAVGCSLMTSEKSLADPSDGDCGGESDLLGSSAVVLAVR